MAARVNGGAGRGVGRRRPRGRFYPSCLIVRVVRRVVAGVRPGCVRDFYTGLWRGGDGGKMGRGDEGT